MIDSCNSGDHIGVDKKQMNITCNIEELPSRLATVSNRLLRGLKYVLLDPNLRHLILHLFQTFGPHTYVVFGFQRVRTSVVSFSLLLQGL